MTRGRRLWTIGLALAAFIGLALALGGCGDGEEAPSPEATARTPTVTRTPGAAAPAVTPAASPGAAVASPAAGAASPVAGGETPPPAESPEAAAPPPGSDDEVRGRLSRAAILLEDLPTGFQLNSDAYSNNEEAAAAPGAAPGSDELFGRCGRLLGRAVSYLAANPQDMVVAGRPVAFFSTVSAFGDADGASLCYQETLRQAAEGRGGSIGRQFGEVFVDPDNVQVAVAEFPTIGEQSLAFTASGETLAQGNRIGIVVLAVSFRQGPTTAVVGAIKVVLAPQTSDVQPLAELVAQRIREEFGG